MASWVGLGSPSAQYFPPQSIGILSYHYQHILTMYKPSKIASAILRVYCVLTPENQLYIVRSQDYFECSRDVLDIR